MDYFSAFDISLSGMSVEKLRLDTVAMNLANTNTTRTLTGGPYKPLEVVVTQKMADSFDKQMNRFDAIYKGVEVTDIREKSIAPKMVYQPEHPDADEKGMVAYPDINPVSEMVTLMQSTRSYEANVKAINAAKTMALKALEIGE